MEEAFAKQCSIATPRRSERQKRLSAKGQEYVALSKSRKTKGLYYVSSESELEQEFDTRESPEKPIVLHDNETLAGDKIFTFQSRKKCEPVLPKPTPKKDVVPKTPHALRNKMKKDITAKILEEMSESDFSDSGSDTDESTSSSQDSTDHEVPIKNKAKLVNTTNKYKDLAQRKYTIKTDDYFSNHSSKKILTSSHTLDKLDTPRLPQDQLQKLLSKVNLGKSHETAIHHLRERGKGHFNKWLYLMHENINILLYGLGSKQDILNSFRQECLPNLPTIVVNGFFPSLTTKDILDGIILELLELKENPANIYEACDLIEKEFTYIPDTHLYIIVHNIDMIRSVKAQNVFARLAAVDNIHLLASIDHINAPLIWDHSRLSQFNFTWWDVTTFQPYIDETSFESCMLVQRTGTLALSSLRNVFLSLTSNSKGIYLILVKYQIKNGKKQYYEGLAFKDLYSLCREAFLVSSDLALRAQLSEFVDHKMVKFKRSADGTENLIIPISNALLQQFLNEQS